MYFAIRAVVLIVIFIGAVEMLANFYSFLYNEPAATKRLKVASVPMSCDRDPDSNRAEIARTVDAIMQAHPDVELVVF